VSMPIARPAILSGLLLAWLRAFGEFGATVMVAYHPYSLPVYTYVAFGSQGLPTMLPVLLPTLALALAIMALSTLAAAPAKRRPQASSPYEPLPHSVVIARPADGAISKAGAIDLSLQMEKQLGTFYLNVAWSPQARRLAVLGPSGAGKSLLLKLIAGLERCDRGNILVDGEDISVLGPAARRIAYVPQNYGLFPNLSVIENLRFPVDADADRAEYWINHLRLRGLEDRRPDSLSLGQQQRVALARALLRPARLLLLDEPLSALDAPLRASLRQDMRALQDEFAATTMIVTHDPAEAVLLADQILLLEDGRVLQAGPADQLLRRPVNETAARLLGAETIAEGTALAPDAIQVGAELPLKVAGPPLLPGSRVGWSVPAARVHLSDSGLYQGMIESAVPVGTDWNVTIGFGRSSIVAQSGSATLARGNACRFDIDPQSVRIWPLDKPPPESGVT
jgi:ABC-type sugar transport system ATPase subunit